MTKLCGQATADEREWRRPTCKISTGKGFLIKLCKDLALKDKDNNLEKEYMENNFALQKQREKVFMARANSAVGMFEFKLCFFSLQKG